MSNTKMQIEKLIKLGHNIPKYDIHNIETDSGWFRCINCNAEVYIDSGNHSITPHCWENDIFGNKYISSAYIVEFNLTCNEVIIMKIIQ